MQIKRKITKLWRKHITFCLTSRINIVILGFGVGILLICIAFIALGSTDNMYLSPLFLITILTILVYQYKTLKKLIFSPIFRMAETLKKANIDLPDDCLGQQLNPLNQLDRLLERLLEKQADFDRFYTAIGGVKENMDEMCSKLLTEASTMEVTAKSAKDNSEYLRLVGEEMQRVAVDITEVSDSSSTLSQKGIDHIEMSKRSMIEIEESEQSVLESSQNVIAYVNEVNEIISMVSEIASLSKLLGVNAAIQAAKAGSAGTGFNVVAKEVKTLSISSKQATLRAAQIIRNIRSAISEMQDNISEGHLRIKKMIAILDETAQVISQLSSIISGTSNVASMISLSATEQTTGLKTMENDIMTLHERSKSHHQTVSTQKISHIIDDAMAASHNQYTPTKTEKSN